MRYPKNLFHMLDYIPLIFDHWVNRVVHLVKPTGKLNKLGHLQYFEMRSFLLSLPFV